MTLQAVTSRELHVAAVILNQVAPQDDQAMDNAADLAPYCSCPVFVCAHQAGLPPVFGNNGG
jgi:hypothetical protein